MSQLKSLSKSLSKKPRLSKFSQFSQFSRFERLEKRDMLSINPIINPVGDFTAQASDSPSGYTPAQITHAYQLDNLLQSGIKLDGTGQTIAIVDAFDDPNIQSDLAAFSTQYGLPAPNLTVVKQNASISTDAGWAEEISLDVEWTHAIAPNAKLLLVEATDSTQLYTEVAWVRQQQEVSVVSLSWGTGDFGNENTKDIYLTTPSGQKGITFVAASGDRGNAGYPTNSLYAFYPSNSPNVVGVGATSLTIDTNNNYLNESATVYSGGGVSLYETEPNYQVKAGISNTGDMRANPDVTFVGNNIPIYDSYTFGSATPWQTVYGTSASAPMFAGLIALADQGRVILGKDTLDGPSQTLPLLYGSKTGFHDITSGGNTTYSATAGYDFVSGLGSPIGNILVPQLINDGATPVSLTTTLKNSLTTLGDSADLEGGYNPTGTITFTLYYGSTLVDTEVVNVNGDGVYSTPTGYTLPTNVGVTGLYQWNASYSGDVNNNSISDVNNSNEQTQINPATPAFSTTPNITSTSLSSGDTLLDTADIENGYFPVGVITFTLIDPNGNTVDTETVNVNGNGKYTVGTGYKVTSGSPIGTYQWNASYVDGNGNNNNISDLNNIAETVSVGKTSPTLSTTPNSSNITLGDASVTLTDSASLQNGTNPTGTLTFTLYVGTTLLDTETVNVNGNGTYITPNGYKLSVDSSVIGTYQWNCVYSGDSFNLTISDNNNSNEQTTIVSSSPTISTLPTPTNLTLDNSSVTLQDSAILSGAYNPDGTIVFYLFAPGVVPAADFSNAIYNETVNVVNGNAKYSTNTGYTLPTTGVVVGTYQWESVYNPVLNNNSSVSDLNNSNEQVVISKASPTITTNPFNATVGQQLTGQVVASFQNQSFILSNYAVTINWGDGTTSDGTISLDSASGVFSILGTHTYEKPGKFKVEINLTSTTLNLDIFNSSKVSPAKPPIELYIDKVYSDLFNRSPSDSEVQDGEAKINMDGRTAFASSLDHSREYFKEIVDADYNKYLGRQADAGGETYWIDLMETGELTDEKLEAKFAASDEYFQHVGGTNSLWVSQMYQDILGRQPDAIGKAFWLSYISLGGSREKVALGFAVSTERERQHIEGNYEKYLGRDPDDTGVNYWLKEFENGKTNEDLITGFLASDEYYNKNS